MTVIVLSALLAAAAAFIGWLIYQLLAQNGRILARLEELEHSDARAKSLTKSRLRRDGLPKGSAAPDFRLPRIGGGELTLSQYRGRKVLVLFSDPGCGPCTALLPELQRRYAAGSDVHVVMVSRGDQEANRAKMAECGVTFPVALQRQWEISKLYGMFATPIAFLVDEQGTTAAPAALGAQRILELIPDEHTLNDSLTPRPRQARA